MGEGGFDAFVGGRSGGRGIGGSDLSLLESSDGGVSPWLSALVSLYFSMHLVTLLLISEHFIKY